MILEKHADGWVEPDEQVEPERGRLQFAENTILAGFFELAHTLAANSTNKWRLARHRNRCSKLTWEPNPECINICWGLSHDT